MNKTKIILASLLAIAVSAPAFAADATSETQTKVESDSKGNVDATTKTDSTDAAGTATSTEKNVDVDVKSDGATDKTVETKSTVDPAGLGNKTSEKTTDEVKKDKTGHVKKHHHKKVVNGTKVEDSTTTDKAN